jgi:serine/threonine protein kinase
LIGQTLSHFKITAKLGEGGMGEVYRAEDTKLGREIALKILPADLASSPERLERFQREARTLAAVDHPNIVHIYSVEQDAGVHFLIMQLVRGVELSERIPAGGMKLREFFDVAISLADALSAAHEKGIVHRDLKPSNVMLDDEGRVKILDFGLAKASLAGSAEGASQLPTEEAMTEEGVILGTVPYMSPEQAQGRAVDARSDMFSLGIILYEMATGGRPFGGDNKLSILTAIMRDTPAPITESHPALPPVLSELITRCLEKDPASRHVDSRHLKDALEQLRAEVVSDTSSASGPAVATARATGTRRLLWSGTALVIAVLAASLWSSNARKQGRIEWARTEAIPRIQELHRNGSTGWLGNDGKPHWFEWGTRAWEAHELATEAALYIGDDPLLEAEWNNVTLDVTFNSQPPGAAVWARPYIDPDGEWRLVGHTPLDAIRFPKGNSRVKLELLGHETVYDLLAIAPWRNRWEYQLDAKGSIPEEMLVISGGPSSLSLPNLSQLPLQTTRDVLMDRYETTNREYKRFVDAGGYESPEHWLHAMVKDDRELSWEEAKGFFTDRTGLPGPATWEVGDFPEDHDDYPVSGVSWFEAAAYAHWAGKSLPTVYHWARAAFVGASGEIVPLSRLSSEGPVPVRSLDSMHRYGVIGLAGNVREWLVNATTETNKRLILGGGWNDEPYAFTDGSAQSPWDRSPSNGLRCIRYLDPDDETSELTLSFEPLFRDFHAEEVASDEVFSIWLKQFAYDATPLNITIEATEEYDDWRRETITFDAAYGNERMMARLFLPRTGTPPFRTIVFFPGSNALRSESSADFDGGGLDFLLKSGHAVILPIYKSTYERSDDLKSDLSDMTVQWKEHVIMWAKDLSRSIDYLETREDLDIDHLVYYGNSFGGAMGGILPAIEPRIKSSVLMVAGMGFDTSLPEVSPINYISRVTVPTLMINGEFDFWFPVETSQNPFYDLLGTPAEHKRHVVFPGSHSVPRTEQIKEMLAWLERYSGSS